MKKQNIFLSIVIPANNEEKRLPQTLLDIQKFLPEFKHATEILVVDDGSKDDTVKAVEKLQTSFKQLKLIKLQPNQGKGAAVKQGMMQAQGEYLLFMDADNATPISELEKLLPFINVYEVVIGSRHLKDSNVVIKQPWYRIIISRIGNVLIQSSIVNGIKDTQCGFKLFQQKAAREIFKRQQITRWGFDMEILAISQKVLGYKIKEVPVSWYNSASSRLRPIRDAWRTFKELVKIKSNLLKGKY